MKTDDLIRSVRRHLKGWRRGRQSVSRGPVIFSSGSGSVGSTAPKYSLPLRPSLPWAGAQVRKSPASKYHHICVDDSFVFFHVFQGFLRNAVHVRQESVFV